MNVTIDREEGILLRQLILGGKEETQEAGSALHGLRITSGGYFEETPAPGPKLDTEIELKRRRKLTLDLHKPVRTQRQHRLALGR